MKKTSILFGSLLLVIAFGSQAWCLTYSATDILNNTTPGAVVTAGTAMSTKTTNIGTIGVGTANGAVAGEIDNAVSNEWIRITFNTAQRVSAFRVAFLFPDGQYGDRVNEKAEIITNFGAQELQALGPDLASWSGSGSVANLELAQSPFGGVWEVINPYVASPISFIEFRAVLLGDDYVGAQNSDYSIVSVTTAAVPEAGTLLLLGLGLVGLAGVRRIR